MICTFFGHRTVPLETEVILQKKIIELIDHYGVDTFYVGNQGGFDRMVIRTLRRLKDIYPNITYTIVLEYMPDNSNDEKNFVDLSNSIYPEGLEKVPPRFAIIKRNQWLMDHSDVVITYACYSASNSVRFKALAQRKGKWVIDVMD